jgi:demethylmenaquinone methyltransferase/2-methoxy-6-polyprenyl-1,4-benzoquinol methylase
MSLLQSNLKKNNYKVFDKIAYRYDLLNLILSIGLDGFWRKKISKFLPKFNKLMLLDVATGTGELLFSLIKNHKIISAIGLDMSLKMLMYAKIKLKTNKQKNKIKLVSGNACYLPFSNNTFNVVTIAFGIRNIDNILDCLCEINRVLVKNGRIIILEFSLPKNRLLKTFYLIYLRYIVPILGFIIANDYAAYKYLNQSIESFNSDNKFLYLIRKSGIKKLQIVHLTFGIVTIYVGDKI